MPDGAPVLLISRLAVHTKNILADARVSLMMDERVAGDPLEGARIMVAGRAEELSGDDAAVARRRYLAALIRPPRRLSISRILPFSGSRRRACISSPVSAASST
jgi:hypothetical protein